MNQTAQEIFDTVAEHLLKQGKQSKAPGDKGCRYRGPDGTKCAVGVLIPDADYRKWMDAGHSIPVDTLLEGRDANRKKHRVPASIKALVPHQCLLATLQGAHDNHWNWDNQMQPMRERLRMIAKRFNLDAYKVPA